jgi:lysophospholipase L1-like esterase
MRRNSVLLRAMLARLPFLMATICVSGAAQIHPEHWVATWTTSVVSSDQPATLSNQTVRNVVHTSIGGSAVRIRLSNTFGTHTLRVNAVFIGLQKEAAALVPKSNHEVTFGGMGAVSIPEGAEMLSDPVSLEVFPEQNLAVSLFVAGDSGLATVHGSTFQANYVSEPGNFAGDEGAGAFTKTTASWYFLSAVDVLAAPDVQGAVVALGDSITDGASSRADQNERWTDVLARRLLRKHIEIAVLNAGIGGNRLLTSSPCWGQNAIARMGRDVFGQAGIVAVILFEGTNDIGQPDTPSRSPCLSKTPVTADDIIAGYQQIITRVHSRGLKIFGATILPYQGFNGWTEKGEAKRAAVNQWIRTSGAFDGVIDFDVTVRDPAHPARMAPQYDSGDHLHPGTAGQEAMGDAVDLGMFK